MKLAEIYNLAINIGIDNDPRGREKVEKLLKKRKAEYEELPAKSKAEYDTDDLVDPYADSGFHLGNPDKEVKTVLVGIDIDSAGVLLAKELERQGKKIDLIIAHHPVGKALAKLHEVMEMQVDIMSSFGIPENIAEGVLRDRLSEVSRSLSPVNHFQAVDTAKLLNVPIINVHTPADNSAWKFMTQTLEKKKPEIVGEIVEAIKEIPEYAEATKMGAGPSIFAGSEKSRAGKTIVDFTGGTSGSEKTYERMSHYGIGTIVTMHMKDPHREEALKHYINVVIASHMASDSLGMNIIMDELEKRGVEIIPCSGFIRVSRAKRN